MAEDSAKTSQQSDLAARTAENGSAPAGRVGQESARDVPQRRRNDLIRNLQLVDLPLEALRPAARRVRKANAAQNARIRRSIEEFGLVRPILITGDDEIVDGHDVVEALRELGVEQAPCLRVDRLNDVEIRRLRIALNKIAETGSWDFDALKLEFEDLLEIETDLEITGFEIGEIDQILAIDEAAEVDPADTEQVEADPDALVASRRGHLWRLGEHRLLCGDARDGADLCRLLGDEPVAMLLTDPPFNVRINGHVRSGKAGFREFAEASGEMDAETFTMFLTDFLNLAGDVLAPGAPAFVFMDWRHLRELDTALSTAGFGVINLCVWVKPVGGMGGLYRSRHELVFVATRGSASTRNNVQLGKFGRNRANVWEYAGATGGDSDPQDDFAAHSTVKPIKLLSDAILDVTAVGDIVLDLFAGSGSTLLAAERTRRRCRALEIDPAYVDLAIRRWQAMTGEDAILEDTGETFEAVARRANAESNVLAGIEAATDDAGDSIKLVRRALSETSALSR